MAKRKSKNSEAKSAWSNRLYFGDNMEILRDHVPAETVDLIYLDPPFNSKKSYNILFRTETGDEPQAQLQAFDDTWHWSQSRPHFEEIMSGATPAPQKAIDAIAGLHRLLGPSEMMAYLVMMTQRLVLLHQVLKKTGSLYLHCDPTASHYLKVVLDSIFGPTQFQNEFIWYYSGGGASKKRWARKHDVILFYTKGSNWTFNADEVRTPYKWTDGQRRADGSDRNLDAGKLPDDVWEHHSLMPWAIERLGYPTQKPEVLLERLIKASSNKGDLVLDPFCGCGTTIAVADHLGRRWIGIDITYLAIDLIQRRLRRQRGERIVGTYRVEGVPKDLPGARALLESNAFEFERWIVTLMNGVPNERQVGDRGIDGKIRFRTGTDEYGTAIISVKGGKQVAPEMVRELLGTVQQEKAELGILAVMEKRTQGMKDAAAEAGSYTLPISGTQYPKVQIVTVRELLSGQLPRMPTPLDPYFKAAPSKGEQLDLGG